MRRMSFKNILGHIRGSVNSSSSEDDYRLWLVRAIHATLDEPRPFSGRESRFVFKADLVVEDCTWNRGDRFFTVSGATTTLQSSTRRSVIIGDRVYKIIDPGVTAAGIWVVDSQIVAESITTPVDLTVYVPFYCIKTSFVFNVAAGENPKLFGIDRRADADYDINRLFASYGWPTTTSESVSPTRYIATPAYLDGPKRPPKFTSTGAGTMAQGRYYVAFSKICSETGIESPLGPIGVYNNTDGYAVRIEYDSITGYVEGETTMLGVYVSRVDPKERTPPMFRYAVVGPTSASYTFQQPSVTSEPTIGLDIHYSGAWTAIALFDRPEWMCQCDVQHTISYGMVIADDEMIDIGNEDDVLDCLKLHVACSAAEQAGDSARQAAKLRGMFTARKNMLATGQAHPSVNDRMYSESGYSQRQAPHYTAHNPVVDGFVLSVNRLGR